MPRQKSITDIRLISKVSILYYLQDYRQQDIAKRLHLSRPKVSRLLKEARERGIVQITVNSNNNSSNLELETGLEQKYNLDEVVITEVDELLASKNTLVMRNQIGMAAANYLQRTISDNEVIGITWGTTLQAMLQSLQPQLTNNIHIVQTTGGVGRPEAGANAAELSRKLSHLLTGRLTLLPAPGIVSNKDARKAYLSEQNVKSAMDSFSKLTSAFAGIGALTTNPIFRDNESIISKKIQNEIKKSGAVGDIALRFFDKDGSPVHTSLDDHLIGITLNEFKEIKHTVGIAGGEQKLTAIRGALKGGLIKVLITDHITATKLLEVE
jgi:DNA-binding transcriptional regulator LsrR (DeoR family)